MSCFRSVILIIFFGKDCERCVMILGCCHICCFLNICEKSVNYNERDRQTMGSAIRLFRNLVSFSQIQTPGLS